MMQEEYTTQADVPTASEDGETSVSTSELQSQLDAANARADENYNKFLLAMADFENYKRRNQRDSARISDAGRREVLKRFLPVVDNLERAVSSKGAESSALLEGVQQTLKGFEALLGMEGVKPLNLKGQKFDPNVAEAIGTHPAEGVQDDTVLEEVQKGYTIGDELLRPAKVIVAKHASE